MSNKMVLCKTCGSQIAAKAKRCPACGAKNKKPFFKKPIFWILIVLVLGFIVTAGSGSDEPSIDYQNPDFTVTADALMQEFSANSVSAKEKYGSKTVKVTGKVSTISNYTVRLSGDNDENMFTNVVLNIVSGQDDVLMSLSKDMQITAVGVFKNTDVFDDIELDSVMIDTNGMQIKQTESAAAQQTDAVIDIDIDTLLNEYENNTVSADGKYKNKTLRVKGKIYGIEDGYIKLEGNDDWELRQVLAYYGSDVDVTALQKGAFITVVGECKGEDMFSNIKLYSCHIEG